MGIKTGISWCDSTWNPTWGCDVVSAGCDHCYAESLSRRIHGNFNIRYMRNALSEKKHRELAQPMPDDDGGKRPRLVFVNSMSDIFHRDIKDTYRDECFTFMEGMPGTVFQALTKRPHEMVRYIEARYGGDRPFPLNIWLGVSIEDNRVRKRADHLRALKQFFARKSNRLPTLFFSIEPLIGPVDDVDFTDIDWVIIGGESGPGCRPMEEKWVWSALRLSRQERCAVWFKQWGHVRNHPHFGDLPDTLKAPSRAKEALVWLAEHHLELKPEEKGGATIGGKIVHELPPSYFALQEEMRSGSLL